MRYVRYLVLSMVAVFAASGNASAVVPINTCPATCSSNCYLNNSVTCTNGNGITLSSGADLDMHRNNITCTSASCSNASIIMTAGNSSVSNSLGNTPGFASLISGPFNTGVNCDSHTGSEVTGIEITDVTGIMINRCAHISQNRLSGTGLNNIGIEVGAGIAASDSISDNYITDLGFGIEMNPTVGVSVDHNLFTVNDGEVAIAFGSSTASTAEVKNNIVMGETTRALLEALGTAPPSSIFDNNYCDPSTSACGNCVGLSRCEDPIAPFVLP